MTRLCLHLAQCLLRRHDTTVLHRQRLQACTVQLRRIRRDGVGYDHGLKAFMKGTARRVLDADLSDGSGDENRVDAVRDQQIGEPRAVESVVTVLVDLLLALQWNQLVDYGDAVALTLDVTVCAPEAGPAAADGGRDLG